MQLKNLKTSFLGRDLLYFKSIDSTQKEMYRRINENKIKNRTVIWADIQTEGIGTHGKKWYTDEENNIAFSFFVEMNCNLENLNGITLEIVETVLKIFANKYNITLQIKEPNDIYYNGKKLGGIYNFEGQVVISGEKEGVQEAEKIAK